MRQFHHLPGARFELQPWLHTGRRIVRWMDHPWRETPAIIRFALVWAALNLAIALYAIRSMGAVSGK